MYTTMDCQSCITVVSQAMRPFPSMKNIHHHIHHHLLEIADLSRELPQPSGHRQALLEQYVVKGGAAERLQVHLVFIIPELIQNICRQKIQNMRADIKNSNCLPRAIWQQQI